MGKIFIKGQNGHILYEPGQTLMEILLQEGVFINNSCNGKGTCGKCKVRVLEGYENVYSPSEQRLLRKEEQEENIRLACLLVPEGDIRIELLEEEKKHEILTEGTIPQFDFSPEITEKTVCIQKPGLADQTPFEEQIKQQLDLPEMSLPTLRKIGKGEGLYRAVTHRKQLLNLQEMPTSEKLYGVAVDIGTTTVAACLVDLATGIELAQAAVINEQKQYGLDVLTRITYEIENPQEGRNRLRQAITDSLDKQIRQMCAEAGIDSDSVYEITTSANSTMLHMFLGVDAVSLGTSPFAPIFTAGRYFSAADTGLKTAENAVVYLLPAVSSYIGADIVAGAYVCGLQRTNRRVLFIDIGTNGEIVLASGGRLLSCSCAAGPALEGMNIRSGMRAAEGAVEDVRLTPEGAELNVIGGGKAKGFCGSGILAVIRELLKNGLIEKNGTILKPEKLDDSDWRKKFLQLNGKKREVVLAPELIVTQSDIRQVQLAKGAILSGFYALLKQAGITMEDLDEVIVAGQFGMHLPVESLTGTGILPKEVGNRLTYVGNSSKTGAYMALMSGSVKREMEKLAKKMEYMELSASQGYERLFSQCLQF
ncbi:ASKHA domain-containing protein [Zhenpiania hominis]|uniref:ASKHA domain-containing protein n=1 Tax=Zhenpiania hominis TaxID=2763644 RepID=UPI0039F4623E